MELTANTKVYNTYTYINGIDKGTKYNGTNSNIHSTTIAPGFVSKIDVHLTSSSPMYIRKMGTKSDAPQTDKDGKSRPGSDGYVSMGAYEYENIGDGSGR